MATSNLTKGDPCVEQLDRTLEVYRGAYPAARVNVRRYNMHSIRIRIIDDQFVGWDRTRRHRFVWAYLEPLSEDILSDISMLLLLTPDECASSLMNLEFEDPSPSDIK